MKRGIIIATAILLIVLPICKGKSNEEKIRELEKKLENAKTEKEVEIYTNEIERLQQEEKENAKTITIKLGEPFTLWQNRQGPGEPEKKSEFRVTFKDPLIDKFLPYEAKFVEYFKGQKTPTKRTPADQGKKYFGIIVKVENLGPRESSLEQEIELKVDKGFIYRLGGYMVDNPEENFPRNIFTLEPSKIGWLRLWCQIPDDANPVEISGKLGEGHFGAPGYTKFSLKLNKLEKSITETEKQKENTLTSQQKATNTFNIKKEGTKKSLLSCRIKEIQFHHPRQEWTMNSGKIVYLTDDEIPITKEFTNLSTGEISFDSNGWIYIHDTLKGKGWEKNLELKMIQKISFETIPYNIVKSWPARFKTGTIPEIKIYVQYIDGKEETYVTYATYWIYFYEMPLINTKSSNEEQKSNNFMPQSIGETWKRDEQQLKNTTSTAPQFKELTEKERADAEQLFEMALTQRKMARLPGMSYQQMVNLCRQIINKYPNSEYAYKAKRMLSDLPDDQRKMYNITDEEITMPDQSQELRNLERERIRRSILKRPTQSSGGEGGLRRPIRPIGTNSTKDEEENISQQINTKLKAYSNKDQFPLPPISLTLRMTTPDLVEKVETIYFTALDYQYFSIRSLRFAKEFLNEGDLVKSKIYIEKADRFYKLATALQRDSFSVLDSTYSAAQWKVAYEASKTALGFAVPGGLGVKGSILFDLGTLYTDYSLDKSMMPLEEAKKNLIAKSITTVLLQYTGASEAVGDVVKQGWGSSRAFPVLQKIIGTSEFKDAVLKEFMRLGGDVGDYVAKKTIEEVLERIIKGEMENSSNTTSPRNSYILPERC